LKETEYSFNPKPFCQVIIENAFVVLPLDYFCLDEQILGLAYRMADLVIVVKVLFLEAFNHDERPLSADSVKGHLNRFNLTR
jgi:hypothetical protein